MESMNFFYRGRGIGAVCVICKDEVCPDPQAPFEVEKLNLGECQICHSRARVASPEVWGGIRKQLA